MLEADIFKAVLDEDPNLASYLLSKYGKETVFRNLNNSGLENIFFRLIQDSYPEIKSFLDVHEKKNKLTNKLAKTISKELIENNVGHVFFKGSALSIGYYSNASDRSYNDFDILINTKNLENFYSYLNKKNLKHRRNGNYLSRPGYTRTALEVIASNTGITYDFHHRIICKYFSNICPLTREIFENKYPDSEICVPKKEILLCASLYHAVKQNRYMVGPSFMIDISKLIYYKYDGEYLSFLLKETELERPFMTIVKTLEKIRENKIDKKTELMLRGLFRKKIHRGITIDKRLLFLNLMQLKDPEPYINLTGGDKNKPKYLEFFKCKYKKLIN